MDEHQSFVVPFQDLSRQQKEIVEQATDTNESFFVEGPPGSGKTLISLHIIKSMIGKEIVNPLVLIYNNSLLGYLRASFNKLGIKGVTINTKDSFFWSLKRQYNITIDEKAVYKTKYEQILMGLLEKEIDLKYSVVILDEIQDFYEDEWKILKKLGTRFVFLGDFEQKIYDGDLNKRSITSFSISKILKKVFRFGSKIAKFVERFSKSKKQLETDREDTVIPIVQECEDIDEELKELLEIIKVRKSDGKRIGIISLNKNRLEDVHQYLTSKGEDHFHAPNPNDFKNYDFSTNKTVLITSASAKGLEFSTVIVIGFDKGSPAVWGFRKNGGLKENIYVCLSRATDHLYILRNPNTISELYDLPEEELNDEDEDDDWF